MSASTRDTDGASTRDTDGAPTRDTDGAPVVPEGVAEARAVVDGVDRALGSGLARLSPDARAALGELGHAVAGTPLGLAVSEAIAAIERGELLAHHLGALAAGRAAIEGAVCDALLAAMVTSTGLVLEPPTLGPAPAPDARTLALMQSAQQWLVEIALAGFGQLDLSTVSPALAALRTLQEHPPLRRLAALLTGFAHELADAAPTSGSTELPLRRWADLWSTAMLASSALPAAPTRRSVTGVLTPLGADLVHHDHLVSLVAHGLFEEDGQPRRLVRITLSVWRVDAIAGPEVFTRLAPLAPELVAAIASPVRLQITGATALGSGDLLWDGKVKPLPGAVQPHAIDLAGATITAPPPRDRHAVQLAVPVVGAPPEGVPLAFDRTSPLAGLDEGDDRGALGFVGLLRYDDGFCVQPLAFATKKELRGPAKGIVDAGKLKDRAAAVLEERAGRLLRKS